jgi:16S rRNA (guanine(966)-N(2))-methyltransferase RsmD
MGGIRVISGSAKGRKLHLVPGDITRPIPDRVKEALFNILRVDIKGVDFLDLFAGTGSVGIEALSRGASFVRFVERHKLAVRTIRENLELTDLVGKADVVYADVFSVLQKSPDVAFDYVYIAPPQYKGIWLRAVKFLDTSPDWLVEDGWIIVQIDPKEYESLRLTNFEEFDQRRYGNTMLVFYERMQASDEG